KPQFYPRSRPRHRGRPKHPVCRCDAGATRGRIYQRHSRAARLGSSQRNRIPRSRFAGRCARAAKVSEAMNILLTPARIGTVEVPNRIVLPPMTTRTADAGGFATEDTLAYYEARVVGGVGLVTVEMASPEKAGRHRHRELGIYDDRFLPGLTKLVEIIH